MRRARSRCFVLSILAVAIAPACQDATQVSLLIRTNVPFAAGRSVRVHVATTNATAETREPVALIEEGWPSSGEIGTLTVVPASADDAGYVSLRVVLGVTKPATECTIEAPDGCIFARRSLAFLKHRGLELPIRLHAACVGVACDLNSTCNALGRCVSSVVDATTCATTRGCQVPGDEGTGDARVDAATDATVDAAADQDAAVAPGLQVSLGAEHTCVVFENGRVKCWGQNTVGQLGIGDITLRGNMPGQMGAALPVVDLGPGRSALQISAAGTSTCALLDDRRVKCWGGNQFGDLGLGDIAPRGMTPGQLGAALPNVELGTGRTAVEIARGHSHTCARLDDGSVKCWGYNSYGQLGLGDVANRGDEPGEMGDALPAVNLGSGRVAVQVDASGYASCARLDTGQVKCWGANAQGHLGVGDTQNRGDGPGEMGNALPAINLGTGRTARAISVGPSNICALLDNAQVKCWGTVSLGLGDAQPRGALPAHMGDSLAAVNLGAGRTAVQITARAGYAFACARLDNGAVKCWGDNNVGQLGLGDGSSRGDGPGEMGDLLPAIDLGSGETAVHIANGGGASGQACAVLASRSIKCWGYGITLGLGDGAGRGGLANQMGNNLPAVDIGP